MEWYAIIGICVGIFALLAIPGAWIAISLGVAGIVSILILNPTGTQVIANCVWKLCTDFTLTAIPLFLVMGEIIIESGVSKRFYKGLAKYLKHVPGGLLHSNVVACGIFAAISGSSPATAAAIGGVAIPEMDALGYKPQYTYGSIAAGGTLGILIPPSIALIVYGSLCSESVTKLFTAAFVPGFVLLTIYIVYLLLVALIRKDDFKDVDWSVYEDISHKEAAIGIVPLAIMILVVLGCIYAGVATPTEAAAVGALISVAIGVCFGSLNWKSLWVALKKAARTTSMILFIILGANIFSYVMSSTQATLAMVTWLTNMNFSKVQLLAMVYIMYIILGCFLEGTSMQYLTLPVLYPVMINYGFDGIWFGVVLVILMELGMLTPPMGMNLFIVKGIAKNSKMVDIVKGSFPYVLLMLLMILILTFFPQLATFAIK